MFFLNHVNEDIKNSRLYEVQELLRSQQLSFNKKTINSTMKVLVLKKGKKKINILEDHHLISLFTLVLRMRT